VRGGWEIGTALHFPLRERTQVEYALPIKARAEGIIRELYRFSRQALEGISALKTGMRHEEERLGGGGV